MTLTEFEELIATALDGLPAQFAKSLDNVEVLAEIWPTPEELSAGGAGPGSTLFGLYRGIPQTKRGNYTAAVPDKIIIFAGPMLAIFGDNPEVIKEQVKKTVLHEIGHHFGMTEEQIRKAGA